VFYTLIIFIFHVYFSWGIVIDNIIVVFIILSVSRGKPVLCYGKTVLKKVTDESFFRIGILVVCWAVLVDFR